MVKKAENDSRCGSCQAVTGNVWQGFVYCQYYNCDVWAQSLKCEHGKELDEIF